MKALFATGLLSAILTATPGNVARELSGAQRSGSQPSQAMQYLQEGSSYFLKHDFKNAIGPYSKALALEKKHPTLSKTLWRVLVDNLGMAYGITGDLKKAKETFAYGLSRDDKYPLFYYNMACTYAEMDDLDNTVTYLKRAFQYKENVIEGEHMPDPRGDDSFQRFMHNERFLAALREIEEADK
jgi:tetratricopeptide (TPR) repeat protein